MAGSPTRLIWRGSDNQKLNPLSALGELRYRQYVEHEAGKRPCISPI